MARVVLVLFLWFIRGALCGYLPEECPTEILEENRIDCMLGEPASESVCISRGCTWCATYKTGLPWCFYNTKPGYDGRCPSNIPLGDRVDCWPYPDPSNAKCVNAGCVWCPVAGYTWCFYDNTIPEPTQAPTVSPGCPSTIPPDERVDCHTDPSPNRFECESRGCIWCEDGTPGVPWCSYPEPQAGNCPVHIPEFNRVDCHPDPNASQQECEARGCNWCESPIDLVPWCYFSVDSGYLMTSQVDTPTGYRLALQKKGSNTLFGGDINHLTMDVHFETDDRLHIKITDASQTRFEVPLNTPESTTKATNPNYEFNVDNNPIFSFNVKRKNTGTVIFDTSLGGFVYEDQFLQFTQKMPRDSEVFGLGEHEHHSLRHDTSTWHTMGMWSRDQPPDADSNLYGVHPFWWIIEDGINTHGVFVLNANAQDVTISPAPYITYRTIGGILDIYILMGPTPEMLVSQFTEVVGRTFMPPYWSLGFQLCRYGYNSLASLQATVERTRAAGIPFDIQYGDIDYMDEERDFTYNQIDFAGLPAYVDTIHSYGMHFIIILDPCIAIIRDGSYEAFNTGEAMDVWVKNSDCSTSAEGKVWPPENTYFPDYSKPITQIWWTDECVKFHDIIDYDGLWIDMNEPANFVTGSIFGCDTNKYNNPPYKPRLLGSALADKTMCPDACHYLGRHYDMHSLFGYTQAIQTQPAARAATPGKRSVVISRSTFPGLGPYSGHWLGDNWSLWSNLHYSIIGSLEFNMFGIPYIGADICGYIGEAEESMCQRWMQLGSFYTFSRNHNGLNYREQDPAVWPGGEVARVSRETLLIRYTLLPYLYTLFHYAHTFGYTVMRPVFHEFIDDAYTHGIDRQFLWGPAFLITPVLDQGAELGIRKTTVKLDAPMDYIPLHVRGGYILPTQDPDVTTTASRTNPMGLIVAMDDLKSARGDLFWDDGDSIDTYEVGTYLFLEFTATATSITSSITHNGYAGGNSLSWGTVRVFGATAKSVMVNGKAHAEFGAPFTGVLEIYNVKTPVTAALDITWT